MTSTAWFSVGSAAALFGLSPLAGRGRRASLDARRVRGAIRESACVESPPHPDPLPASGERENGRRRFRPNSTYLTSTLAIGALALALGVPSANAQDFG